MVRVPSGVSVLPIVAVGLREERKVVVIAVAVREGCEHHGKVLRIIPGSGEDEQHSRAILAGEFKSPRDNAPRAHHAHRQVPTNPPLLATIQRSVIRLRLPSASRRRSCRASEFAAPRPSK